MDGVQTDRDWYAVMEFGWFDACAVFCGEFLRDGYGLVMCRVQVLKLVVWFC